MDENPKIDKLFQELAKSDQRSGNETTLASVITRMLVPPIIVLACLLSIGDISSSIGIALAFFALIVAAVSGVAWGIVSEKE